ncbi:MAG: hypothetical protein WC667_13485 [Sulfurimonas sp.]
MFISVFVFRYDLSMPKEETKTKSNEVDTNQRNLVEWNLLFGLLLGEDGLEDLSIKHPDNPRHEIKK